MTYFQEHFLCFSASQLIGCGIDLPHHQASLHPWLFAAKPLCVAETPPLPFPEDKNVTSKFRKKPVVIEAFRVPALNDETTQATPHWFVQAMIDGRLVARDDGSILVKTLEDGKAGEAKHVADVGDWVIKGVKGELYPCKPDVFILTYDEVVE